ncbi:MAG: metalloprotease PmbA [Gammaproteobacteria bacterium]|nr:metalloprotease PmbA [Gammaproteobacteria bacterium]
MIDEVDIVRTEGEMQTLVEAILQEASRQGASAAEVSTTRSTGLSVTVRNDSVETVEFDQTGAFAVTVYAGHSKGSARTSDSRAIAIRETVSRALDVARSTRNDPCNGLAEPELMATTVPDVDVFHPAPMDVARAEEVARACESSGLDYDPRVTMSEGVSVGNRQSCRVYGNSHGFVGSQTGTLHNLSCQLIAGDSNGVQRGHWHTIARDAADLETPEQVGGKAAARVVERLSPGKLATGRYPVLFSAEAAQSLVGHLINAISGGSLYRNASFLLDSLGTAVASEHLSLAEDPLLRKGAGSGGFDDDGVATRRKAFIDVGVVRSYALSAYTARRLGMATTGNAGGVRNLTLSGRTLPFDDLVAEMGRGLYVTELMGYGVNAVSGDYSQGAAGFWVEDGEIRHPVHELTIASNLKDMYRDVVALGDDLDARSNVRTPSVLIGAMTVAGQG